jgi:hypothetical protein
MDSKPSIPPDELRRIDIFIGLSYWRWAITYAKTAPHWYTLRREATDPTEFDFLAECIAKYGTGGRFWSKTYTYLYLDQWKYWHMGGIINRDLAPGFESHEEGRG